MKTTDLARRLSDFLSQYLPMECGVSPNTVKTYAFTFTLLLEYMENVNGIKPEALALKHLTKELIIAFLDWLQKERKCGTSTRNNRLAAIHSFFKYMQYRDVSGIANWQDIMSIKPKKAPSPEIKFLTIEGIKLLLRQPNLRTPYGRRDFTLLGFLYDSGCRVQELIDFTYGDLRLGDTVTVRLVGKGSKARIVPLSRAQANNLLVYAKENDLERPENIGKPFFPNPHGNPMTRMAVLKIVKKYTDMARKISPELIPEGLGCHSFRHTKAMHMLDADINLVYIRDFLGHSFSTTTEIYARASEKKKAQAMKRLDPTIIQTGKSSWQKDKDLLAYLKNLRNKG